MFAISPQTQSKNRELVEKLRLKFEILEDSENQYAAKFDIVHGFEPDLKQVYLDLGADLADFNGESSWTLPIPTQIVVGNDLKIRSIQYDADYKNRPEPEDVLRVLR